MKVLLIHGLRFDSRMTNDRFVRSFMKHWRGAELCSANIYGAHLQQALEQRFDVGVVTYEALAIRQAPEWGSVRRLIHRLLARCEQKLIFPQDDYSFAAELDDLVLEANVDQVWTPLTENLDHVYPRSRQLGVPFKHALTGLWERGDQEIADAVARPFSERPTDLGTRVRNLPAYLGRFASGKASFAIDFASMASDRSLICNVSTEDSDALLGSQWLSFLGSCRFTIGRKGGASAVDPKGAHYRRWLLLSALMPNLSSESLSRACGLRPEDEVRLSAVSPRLFEAAATKTCQILEADSYVDGMLPWIHYLPLEPDLSNVSEVFEAMKDYNFCEKVAFDCKKLLIDSGRHSYESFVVEVAGEVGSRITDDYPLPVVQDLDFDVSNATKAEMTAMQLGALSHLSLFRASGDHPPASRAWAKNVRDGTMLIESLLCPWRSASNEAAAV